MRIAFSNIFKTAFCALTVMFALSSCDNDDSPITDNKTNGVDTENIREGYFQAAFFPSTGETIPGSRAVVNGGSTQIQSLVCLIYQKQQDGTYTYYRTDNEEILRYDGTIGNITPQTHIWPLQTITYELPNGDYKAVFVGNADANLFAGQKDNAILSDYQGNFASARLNMPEQGPLAFNEYNMIYLCTVDFSQANPSPNVLMQRVVSNNVYSRQMIDTNDAVSMLVDNIVKQIRENNLTTGLVKGLLETKLLDALSKVTGLNVVAGGLTAIVDRLVNMLLGDIVEKLHEVLLQEITKRLEAALEGNAAAGNQLLGLNYILNPWTTVDALDVTYSKLPMSIDFNRDCKSFYGETTWEKIPVNKKNNITTFNIVSFCGDNCIKEINVNKESNGFTNLLAPILNNLDNQAINGLLVNIHRPLAYTTQPNLQYTTTYELLNLTLSNFSDESTGEPLQLKINLNDIVNLEELVKRLLGDNIITGIIGGLTNELLQPLLNALNEVVLALDIRLPGLNLNNIVIEGSWDVTRVSDGTITSSTTE